MFKFSVCFTREKCVIILFNKDNFSTGFVVKPEGSAMYFNVFLTKPVGVNENLGVERHQRGINPLPSPSSPPPQICEHWTTDLYLPRSHKLPINHSG